MPGLVAATVILGVFLLFEGRFRFGDQARSLTAGDHDRGSTLRVGAAFAVSLVAFVASSLVALLTGVGVLPSIAWQAGLVAMIAGIVLRFVSAVALGAAYTRTLRVDHGKRLVRGGPYRYIRHPGYLGSILLWVGAAFASDDILGIVVIVPLVIWVYVQRIDVEEEMLAAAFGAEYQAYARRTRRLVPLLY